MFNDIFFSVISVIRKANNSRIRVLHSIYRNQPVHHIWHSYRRILCSRYGPINFHFNLSNIYNFSVSFSNCDVHFILPNLARNEKATKGFAQSTSGRWWWPSKHKERFIKALQLEVSFRSHPSHVVVKIFSQKKIYFQLKNFSSFLSLFLRFFLTLKRRNFNNKSSNWRIHRSKFLASATFGRRQRKQ